MNVSNNFTKAYETKLTIVENKLRSISGNEELSQEEKAKETSELKAEKNGLQRKINAEEDTRKKEELKELMDADEAMLQLSTVNEARKSLTASINVTNSQLKTDESRGGEDQDKKEKVEKLEKRLQNITENITSKKVIFSDKEEDEDKGLYKGTNYRKTLDIQI